MPGTVLNTKYTVTGKTLYMELTERWEGGAWTGDMGASSTRMTEV